MCHKAFWFYLFIGKTLLVYAMIFFPNLLIWIWKYYFHKFVKSDGVEFGLEIRQSDSCQEVFLFYWKYFCPENFFIGGVALGS